MSAEIVPTIHLVYLSYFTIKEISEYDSTRDLNGICILKKAIRNNIDEKFKFKPVHIMACFLNPIDKSFYFIHDEKTKKINYEFIKDYMNCIDNDIDFSLKMINKNSFKNSNESNKASININNSQIKREIYQKSSFSLANRLNYSNSMEIVDDCYVIEEVEYLTIDDEVNYYLQDSSVDDIMTFWSKKNNQIMFPRLFYIFKEVIVIQATEVPSERLFSRAGLLSNDKRSRLKSENLSMLVFLNSNI